VKIYNDEFDHYEWFRFENNIIPENYPGIDIEINPQKWVQGETVIYSLQVILKGIDELEISNGFSLLLSIDGKRVNLGNNVNKAFREIVTKNEVFEEAWFEIDKEILFNIALSKKTKFKLIGETEFIQGEFSQFNINTFKEFYKNYIDDSIWELPSFEDDVNDKKFSLRIPINRKPETTFNLFSNILLQNGWSGEVSEFDWDFNIDEISFIQNIDLLFALPIGETEYYYPQFSIIEIMFTEQNIIPLTTKNQFQEYPCSKCPQSFPIIDYSFLFPNKTKEEIMNFSNWSVFRNEGSIYIVIGEDNKIPVNELFGYLSEYFQSETKTDIKLLKDRVKKDYQIKKDKNEAYFLVQEFLKENGYYHGPIDGLFGEKSQKSFQKFLRSKDFYNSEITGKKNIYFTNAITEYQKFIEVEETGWINISMAKKMNK
jgi:hypothetical protein